MSSHLDDVPHNFRGNINYKLEEEIMLGLEIKEKILNNGFLFPFQLQLKNLRIIKTCKTCSLAIIAYNYLATYH